MTSNQTPGVPASSAAASSGAPGSAGDSGVRILDDDECWRLLASTGLGRFAVRVGNGVDVFPINYLVHDRQLYFRTAPGSKLVSLASKPTVAFEIDGEHARHVWSVVVHGTAHQVDPGQELEGSGIKLLATTHPSEKNNYVRITPATVSGRSFAKALLT